MATNHFNSVADHVISPTQLAFMRGRNILDGVVIIHETIHGLHRKKFNGITTTEIHSRGRKASIEAVMPAASTFPPLQIAICRDGCLAASSNGTCRAASTNLFAEAAAI